MRTAAGLSIVFCLTLFSGHAASQDLAPRAYWPSPTGTKVVTIGYSYLTGDVIPDRSLPITGVDSDIDSLHFAYRQTFSLWNRTANITVDVPFVSGETVGTRDSELDISREYEGVGDIGTTLAVNFIGAPAMNGRQFGELRKNPHPIFGGSVKLVAPTGKYDSNRLLNVGANRWAAKLELGYIAPLNPEWLLELSLGGWFFADNDEFLGGSKEQDPVATLQVHLIRHFESGIWVSLDGNYYQGGRSKIGGRRLDDLQRDSKIGGTVVFPFAKGKAVKVGYSHGSLNDSSESFNAYQISYQHLF